jgi:hypothetical protein
MPFKKGEIANPVGRTPGTSSGQILGDLLRQTAQLVCDATSPAGRSGGKTRLRWMMMQWSEAEPGEFLKWLATIIPKQREIEIGGDLNHHLHLPDVAPGAEDYSEWLTRRQQEIEVVQSNGD